jgi:hypothetical protein
MSEPALVQDDHLVGEVFYSPNENCQWHRQRSQAPTQTHDRRFYCQPRSHPDLVRRMPWSDPPHPPKPVDDKTTRAALTTQGASAIARSSWKAALRLNRA